MKYAIYKKSWKSYELLRGGAKKFAFNVYIGHWDLRPGLSPQVFEAEKREEMRHPQSVCTYTFTKNSPRLLQSLLTWQCKHYSTKWEMCSFTILLCAVEQLCQCTHIQHSSLILKHWLIHTVNQCTCWVVKNVKPQRRNTKKITVYHWHAKQSQILYVSDDNTLYST